jgi:hypothetical protein
MYPAVGLATSEARILRLQFSGGHKGGGTWAPVPIHHGSAHKVRTIYGEDKLAVTWNYRLRMNWARDRGHGVSSIGSTPKQKSESHNAENIGHAPVWVRFGLHGSTPDTQNKNIHYVRRRF